MKTKSRIFLPLVIALVASPVLPALGATQSQIFWNDLQRTEGSQDALATLPATVASERSLAEAMAADYFALERQKTEGYSGEQSRPDERAMLSKKKVAADGKAPS